MKSTGAGRATWIAVGAAAVWASGLVVAAFLLPVYGSTISSSSSTGIAPRNVVQPSQTLVEVNGPVVAVVMAVPLAVTLVVGTALRYRAQRGALVLAWSATGALGVLTLLGMLTIGVLLIPVTAALVLACFMASRRAPAAGG